MILELLLIRKVVIFAPFFFSCRAIIFPVCDFDRNGKCRILSVQINLILMGDVWKDDDVLESYQYFSNAPYFSSFYSGIYTVKN